MTDLTQIKQAQARLAWALKQQEELDQEWAKTEKAYNEAVESKVKALREQLEAEHADVTEQVKQMRQRVQEQKDTIKQQRDEIKNQLSNSIPHDGDKKPLPGFSRRDSIKCDLPDDDGLLITELAQTAPYLLKVDRKALDKFIRAFATETRIGGAYPMLPEPARTLMPVLNKSLEFDYTWTISNTTLLKNAPDTNPDATTELAGATHESPTEDTPTLPETNDIPF